MVHIREDFRSRRVKSQNIRYIPEKILDQGEENPKTYRERTFAMVLLHFLAYVRPKRGREDP
jgi:hypothetical protein